VMQLRDLSGAVHLIPYSEVTSIINMTQDFSFYLMDIGVAYREDTDEVCALLRELADELRADPRFGPNMLDTLEVLGVDKFADSAVVIKARLKTRPGAQWSTGREFNRRMKQRFDAHGIEIPFPHTTVYFGEPKQGQAPPARLELARAPQTESSLPVDGD
jgi:moderate conductance mechanosensitive channel